MSWSSTAPRFVATMSPDSRPLSCEQRRCIEDELAKWWTGGGLLVVPVGYRLHLVNDDGELIPLNDIPVTTDREAQTS